MLRRTTLALVFLATVAAPAADARIAVPPATAQLVPGALATPAALADSVTQELNRVRAQHGLRPLRASRALMRSARRHSIQMGRRGYFDHDSVDGTPFWRRIERFYGDNGFSSWEVGENIFWQSPRTLAGLSVVRSWLGSSGHRENMLSREWRDVGVGVVNMSAAPGVYRGSAVTIVTVDFGNRRR
jgi:uncharacterized protein YkwD